MLQRNDTSEAQHVPAWPSEEYPDHHSFVVGPGEEIDWPIRLGAFSLVEEPPKPRRKEAATVVADKEVGEPQ